MNNKSNQTAEAIAEKYWNDNCDYEYQVMTKERFMAFAASSTPTEEEKAEQWFLNRVKAILVASGYAKRDVVLCSKSWLQLYREGLKPWQAVIEDMELGGNISQFQWSKVLAELELIEGRTESAQPGEQETKEIKYTPSFGNRTVKDRQHELELSAGLELELSQSHLCCTKCYPPVGEQRHSHVSAFKCNACGSEMKDLGDGTFAWIESQPQSQPKSEQEIEKAAAIKFIEQHYKNNHHPLILTLRKNQGFNMDEVAEVLMAFSKPRQ